MSLASGEQRTLAEIESQLHRSDPAFAAMFTVLADADTRKQPAHECLPRRPLGPNNSTRVIIVLAVGAMFLVACIVMAVVATSHVAPPQEGHGQGVSPAGAYFP